METVKKKIDQLRSMRDKAVREADEFEAGIAEKIAKTEELEALLPKYNKELSDLEDNLDAAESRLVSLLGQQYESEKKIHEGSQAQKLLENRKQRDDEYVQKLNNELEELKGRNADDEVVISKLEEENQVNEETVEIKEKMAEELGNRAKQLEMKMTDLGNALRMMELNEIESNGRKTAVEKKIEEIIEKLKEVNDRAEEFEKKSAAMVEATEEREIELTKVKDNYIHFQHEFQSLVAEIGEM